MRIHSLISYAIFVAIATLLVSCSSKKSSVKGSQGYTSISGTHTNAPDYSQETKDALSMALIAEAQQWIGTPYKYGGQDHNGVDCSGFVMKIYENVCTIKIPRSTAQQIQYCTEIARNKAQIGDLFFFGASTKGNSDVSHVGLYIGGGDMIHASSSRGVVVSSVDDGYWSNRFRGVGRVERAKEIWAKTRRGNKSTYSDLESTPISAIEYETQSSTPTTTSIDLLDLIINQTVDSIFSGRFME